MKFITHNNQLVCSLEDLLKIAAVTVSLPCKY